MSFPGFLLSQWYNILSVARMTRGQAGINAFRTYLNGAGNTTIRFFIDGTPGYGHQTSSANLIRRLCQPANGNPPGYDYAETIEVCINVTNQASYQDTLDKMLLLLPELVGNGNGPYAFYNATINFLQYNKAQPPAPKVNLGFSGGADPDDHYAAALNVAYFLRLQPYRYTTAPEQLQFFDSKYPYVDLNYQYVLGYSMFVQRAYVQPITPPVWANYANNQQALMIQWLTDPVQLGQFDFQPIYSIRYPKFCELGNPDKALTIVLAATLAAQQQTRPAVVVNLDVYDAPVNNGQYGLAQIAGLLATTSGLASDQIAVNQTTARVQAFTPLQAAQRFDFFIFDPTVNNLALLQAKVANWLLAGNDNRVLYVQLGRIGHPIDPNIFNYAFSEATLPAVFEGPNSANLCFNLGNAYLHANKPYKVGIEQQYPGDLLSAHVDSGVGKELQAIADQILTEFIEWPLAPPNPVTVLGNFIVDRNNPKYTNYFTGLQTFYANPLEDKFNLGVCFLNYIINGVARQALLRGGAMADAGGDTLDSIYTAFSTAAQGRKPVVFRDQLDASSQIATFIASVEKQFGAFVTDNTAVTREPASGDITKVMVTGTTSIFGSGLVATVQADFTAPDGVVNLVCRYTGDVAWRPDGVPWIGFGGPFIEFTVADADLPVAGKVGGRLLGADIDFYAVLPPNNGALLFAGDFVSPPSIQKLFQVAGGVNLVASLPPPLSIITQLELTHVEFGTKTSGSPLSFSIEYFFFELVWKPANPNAGWQLLPNLTLENIVIGISLPIPGSENSLKANINGNFRIGKKTDPDAAQVAVDVTAPELTYQAQLTSGEIKLTDLIGMFVPGITIDAPSLPVITQFSLSGVQKTGDFLLTCQLGFDWKIPSNDVALLELKDIGLMANRAGGATTGQLTGQVTLLPNDPRNALTLALTADYLGKDKGWKFSAQQTSDDQQLSLVALIAKYLGGFDAPQDYGINGISFSTTPSAHTYSVAGKTAKPWSVPFMSSITVSASMDLSYDPAQKGSPYSGKLAATVTWSTWSLMKIDLACVFGEGKYTYTVDWGAFHAEIAKNDKEQWVAKGKLSGVTLGGIIEDFISFATGSRYGLGAPWNLLDSIPLDDFQLTFNFATKEIGFDISIGSIDLGFCSIKGITVNYDGSSAKPKVQVTLDGTFPWTTEAPSWNATNPAETPAPPGGGNEFLDLRLLALGQHVEVTSTEPFTTVEAVIKALRNLDPDGAPIAGPNGNVKFSPNNSWLVGADFGVMKIKDEENGGGALVALGDDPAPGYVVNLSIIFNDPNLYGARIALAGPAAKILNGLVFEILYRRISDTIGVYQIDLTLPDKMRKFDVGAYSLTLPSLALDIYTNGDFTIDLGFPWNQDFSRSFMVQAIIPPGIPVLGAAGFYFGKLSSETSNQVPTIDNGRFDPVIIFGFGITVGIGKDVDYGILKAGFSLTVFGIIQGVIAKFCPYPNNSNLPAESGQMQDGYYFELQGTFGIIGMLYGSIDFVIIKASVSVTIKVMAQITYISYQDIPISLIASVDVTASLSINLGLFSITIHFSFSMTIKETFTIKNTGKSPPWHVTGDSHPAKLAAAHLSRLSAASDDKHYVLLAPDGKLTNLYWDNLAPMAPVGLTGYWGPALTVSGDAAAKASDQKVCYVNILAIVSSDPTVPRAPKDTDTSFDSLARQVLRWIVAAALPEKTGFYSADYIDNSVVVSPDDLAVLLKALNKPTDTTRMSADDADTFMTNQFTLNISLPGSDIHNAAPFPVSPKLVLDVPAYGNAPELTYAFADFNSASAAYLDTLRTYFDDLTVQVQKETPKQQSVTAMVDKATSVASFVFSDYFRLIGQQMIEAARDALRSFKYPLTDPPGYGASAGAAVQWINAAGAPEFGLADLFEANTGHELLDKQNVFIYGAAGQTSANPTLTSIATDYNNLFSPVVVATANAATRNLLVTGATVTYNSKPYSVSAGDSLNDLAAKAGATLVELLAANASGILTQQGLIAVNATFTAPGGARSQAAEDATFNSIPNAYQNLFSGAELATANAASINLLTPGLTIEYPSKPTYILLPRDSLNGVAAQFGVPLADLLQHATVLPDHASLLDRKGLIPTFAVLELPGFTYSTPDRQKHPEATPDTPASVSQRFGITVRALGTTANAGVTFEQVKVTTLDLPHLAQLKVGPLIGEIARTNGLSRISGMTGRYALHGLRLPTAGLTQNFPSICGAAADCGLYSLTGQQFAVPALATQDFSFSLVLPNNLPWVKFGGPKLTTTLKPPKDPKNPTANDDQNWLKVVALQSFVASNGYLVSPPGTTIGPQPVYRDQPTTWPTTSVTGWQNAGSVTLPYGTPPVGIQALRLWGLPDTLLNLDDANRGAPPRVQAMRGDYDEGTGQTVETELKYHGWATRVGLTIKKMPADASSPTGAFTYQLIGSGEADIVLLERLLTKLSGASGPVNSLVLLYPPDASTGAPAGLQSDNSATVTLGILQANLSTVTNPPTLAAAAREQQSVFAGCLNAPYDFVKLLWECSITRSGGYYLYYFESASGTGFPGTIFNDKGEASLTLLVVQTKPSDVTKQDLVGGFINCLITGDAFDAKSTVYGKSAPLSNNYQPLATDSLATFAYRYYMDPVALAEANPDAALAAKPLTLARGVYDVGSAQPGGDPNAIANHFATTLPALQAANPQITDWNQTFPLDTVLRLPTLQLTVGTSFGGTTLASIAAYYGTSGSEIAADNADAIGLLAGQGLTVPGGPMSRSSTVPAGCISIAASRAVPQPVPAPSDKNFGRLYIENQIVLLGYRMYGNAWFKVTNPGLPISHSDDPPSHLAADRTRTPMRAALDDSPPWKFQRAIPAAHNAVPTQQKSANLPAPGDSPYAGVGGLAQLELGWVDVFGNTVKSDIGNNPDGTPTRNRPPLPLNYVDALIGFGQWSGVSADYSVLTPNNGSPTISLGLSFDPSGYSPDPNSKVPQTDPPGWQVNARQALLVYDRLYQQLSQKLGPASNRVAAVTLALTSTLLPTSDLTLDATARAKLMAWLFEQGGIYPFLAARAKGDTSWPAPADYPISVTFKLTDINAEQLFQLSTSFTLSRPSTLVDPAFADTAGFISSATTIKPHLVKEADGTYRLTCFACQLETCLSQAGVCAYKLASGVNRTQAMQTGETKPLWLVRLGTAAGQAISFQIPDAVNPLIFAPKPLYNTLQSRPSLSYYDYVSGKGIDFTTPSGTMPVNAVDVDSWMRDYLAAIDTIFSPEFLTPVALVDQLASVSHTSWQTQLRAIKESLATSLSGLVIPFFQDEAPTTDQLDAAQQAFGQQALIALSNIYAVNAVVQFGATVTASIDDPLAQEPPQLYGTLLAGSNSDAGVSLTAAKLALSSTKKDTTTPLTFLVTATGKTAQGATESVITLDLTYRGSQIEHQIGQLPNIEKYKASSWLSFVTPPAPGATGWPLDARLGPFKVPLPLRIFPTPPSMVSQDAITHKLEQPVTWQKIVAAMQWDYSFTYAESFHYPQDQTHFTTTFNIVDGRLMAMVGVADPVPDLFEFITVYPQVQGDLTKKLTAITQASSQKDIDDAAVALNAFVQLAQRASTALAAFLPPPQQQQNFSARAAIGSALRGQLPYQYVVSESSVPKTNPDGEPVSALLVALGPAPPDGIATPSINISGYDTVPDPPPQDFTYGYCYTQSAADGNKAAAAADYLTDVKGQAIAQRSVVLPGLNILSAQSALTSGLIERNQDLIRPRKTAEPFVYQTAPVAFPTALRPTIDIPDEIDIASFGGNTPVARTFADQLDNLFATLFAKAPAGPQTIQVAAYYTISLNSGLPDVGTLPIPILFLPPMAMQPKLATALHAAALEQEVLTQQQVIAALRAGVYAWCSAFAPQAGGDLVFNLTIMTSLQGEGLPPMPLLVLEQLTLHYKDWSDHPALIAGQSEAAE